MRLAEYSLLEIAERLATVMEDIVTGRRILAWMRIQLVQQPKMPKGSRRRIRKSCRRIRKGLPELERRKEILTDAVRLATGIPDAQLETRTKYLELRRLANQGDRRTRPCRTAKSEAEFHLELLRESCEHPFVYGIEPAASATPPVCGQRACAVCGLDVGADARGRYGPLETEGARVYQPVSPSAYAFRDRVYAQTETMEQIIDPFVTDEMLQLLQTLRLP